MQSSIEYVYSAEAFEQCGISYIQKGCDGKMYEHLDIKGSYHGYSGTFEFIKDEKGIITHRFFNINRTFLPYNKVETSFQLWCHAANNEFGACQHKKVILFVDMRRNR